MPLGPARYDVILCRNLLIYFGEAAFMALIERFARALVPGGYLMLGHSESLIDRSPSFRAGAYSTAWWCTSAAPPTR